LVSWTRERSLQLIRDVGVIPIIRVPSTEDSFRAVEFLIESGIGIVEITMTVPNPIRVLESVVDKFGDQTLIGAGTVRNTEMLRATLQAGAQFIVTPALNVDVIRISRENEKPCFPGSLTPTEVLAAWDAGADMVKVFPCGPAGGPDYLKALKGPLPDIEMVPTGGVNLNNAAKFIEAGASAIAVGSELVNPTLLRKGLGQEIVVAARQYMDAVKTARASIASSRP
jgi:2-dehydro-3-deoxyphosphogluconate aldolase/(4S)-4-hydroxy-2-oxoglutarate aldolase